MTIDEIKALDLEGIEARAAQIADEMTAEGADLEALNGKIEGLISLTVTKADLPSSNADIMLDSSFVSEQALGGYQTHPLHIAAASFVRANTQSRLCADFNV